MSRELVVQTRQDLTKMEGEFARALPPHISPEKFTRIAITAVTSNPDLLAADRASLMQSCMKAAQDGLLPDGREAALVVFNKKLSRKGEPDRWGKFAQYMPMVAGILKKARNSGDISTISAHVVYENDEFTYELGDNETIRHKPFMGANRGKPVAVYAIAHLKDGGIMREIMSVADVELVRSASKAKDADTWVKWWGEMAKKTVIRRLSKYLPSSTDKEQKLLKTIERDDENFDFDSAPQLETDKDVKPSESINQQIEQRAATRKAKPVAADPVKEAVTIDAEVMDITPEPQTEVKEEEAMFED